MFFFLLFGSILYFSKLLVIIIHIGLAWNETVEYSKGRDRRFDDIIVLLSGVFIGESDISDISSFD